ncbi:MAG: hypothetical protein K2X37_03215 [Chitinophagaceae bacterium]|nr:hypothetical protein [Chitinophagaceae bacterium]
MVVISITAVLSAVSIPVFNSYLIRGKTAEITKTAEGSINSWLLSNQTSQPFPAASGPIGRYIQTIIVDGTGVSVLINSPSNIDPSLNGATVKYTPTLVEATNTITWSCAVSTLQPGGGSTPSYYTTTTRPTTGYGNPSGWQGFPSSSTLYAHLTNFHQHTNWIPGGGSSLAPNAEATRLICG